MSNKKEKEKWKKLLEHNHKTCLNCSQLWWGEDGNPRCCYIIGKGSRSGGCIHSISYIKQVHEICYDKYNGKNIWID